MVNINTALPTAIATPFQPPTEALHHDNLIKPVIPKTEVIASYTKLREDEKNPRFSSQLREIIQDENEGADNAETEQQSTAEQRRLNFFAKRSKTVSENESKALVIVKDFKLAILIIQDKYKRAVNPIPDPSIDYAL